MSEAHITFENPPADRRGRHGKDWDAVADALRARPGEWALVATTSPSLSAEIKNGRRAAFRPPGAFESTVRKNGKKHDIYVRYVGEGA